MLLFTFTLTFYSFYLGDFLIPQFGSNLGVASEIHVCFPKDVVNHKLIHDFSKLFLSVTNIQIKKEEGKFILMAV